MFSAPKMATKSSFDCYSFANRPYPSDRLDIYCWTPRCNTWDRRMNGKVTFSEGYTDIPFTNWGVEIFSARGVVDWVESETGRGVYILSTRGGTYLSAKEEEMRDYGLWESDILGSPKNTLKYYGQVNERNWPLLKPGHLETSLDNIVRKLTISSARARASPLEHFASKASLKKI